MCQICKKRTSILSSMFSALSPLISNCICKSTYFFNYCVYILWSNFFGRRSSLVQVYSLLPVRKLFSDRSENTFEHVSPQSESFLPRSSSFWPAVRKFRTGQKWCTLCHRKFSPRRCRLPMLLPHVTPHVSLRVPPHVHGDSIFVDVLFHIV